MRGKERVSTKCGLLFSFTLVSLLIYAFVLSLTQIATFQRMTKTEKLDYGKAVDEVIDFSDQAANIAFRAINMVS